jgi:hypothetical protein
LNEAASIGLAFVAQHVVLVGDDQRGRQAAELIERSTKRRGRSVPAYPGPRSIRYAPPTDPPAY